MEETWRVLEAAGIDVPRKCGIPSVAKRMPRPDDASPVGLGFFRELWKNTTFAEMTLPRTFIARSEYGAVSFRDSGLSECWMCWNDFINCDFTGADLRGCDMRSSTFESCLFRDADLSGADLRISGFKKCDFEGARLTAALADTPSARGGLVKSLTAAQRASMKWSKEPGDLPPGG